MISVHKRLGLVGINGWTGRRSDPTRTGRRRRQPGFDSLESKTLLRVTIIDLGDLGGGVSDGEGINNLGQVVGYSKTASGEEHAFIYSNGQMTDLGTAGTTSYAYAINDSGTVVGNTFDPTTSNSTAFEDSNGTMTSLGSLQGADGSSFASGVNSSGAVVGYSSAGPQGNTYLEGYVYSGGAMHGLGVLGYDDSSGLPLDSQAVGINDAGTTVGYGDVDNVQEGLQVSHAFVDSGTMTDLGLGDGSVAEGINNVGQIIAVTSTGAYLDDAGNLTLITTNAEPVAINSNGDVVGNSAEPFLYKNGQLIDLSSLLPANSGWTLTNVKGINDSDQIVGTGTYRGNQQAYLLSFNAGPITPAITWAKPAAIPYGTALSATQLDATASVPGKFSYSQAIGTVLHAGNNQPLTVTFTPTDTTDYTTATDTVDINVYPLAPPQASAATATRTKKGLTEINLTFNEALNSNVASDTALFQILGAVTKHRKTVYTKPIRIKGIALTGGNHVTIYTAKPFKGAVEVIMHPGILAADGEATTAQSSVILR
jgi:probable HAF family extracellular repeat protein